MRLIHLLAVSSLGLVAGCGGCDSCFGVGGAGDEAGLATSPPTLAPAMAEAGATTEPRDAGRDAAPEPAATAELAPTASGLARPKAPMALGEFQVCGVYDGPLCERACKKGNCKQECDGVTCALTCAAGYCSQLCGPSAKCKMTCNGGHCIQACTKTEGCTKECAGGSCE